MDQGDADIKIEVVYARAGQQRLVKLDLSHGATVGEALQKSGLLQAFPDIPTDAPVGVFGEPCRRTRVLEDGDRVEIYRPLQCDPKAARRERAENTKS